MSTLRASDHKRYDKIRELKGRDLRIAVATQLIGFEIRKRGHRVYDPIVNKEYDGFQNTEKCRDFIAITAPAFDRDWDAIGKFLLPHMEHVSTSTQLEAGWHLRLCSPFTEGEPWWAGFTPKGITGWNGRPDIEMPGETGPEAISRAALVAEAEGKQALEVSLKEESEDD